MALQHQSKKIKIRLPEWLLLICIGFTLGAAYTWWIQPVREGGSYRVPAYVTGISLRPGADPGKLERKDIRVSFNYYVNGHEYKGETDTWRVQQILYHALPEEVKAKLREKGVFSIKELPPKIQSVLAEKGIISFDQIPGTVYETLAAQGYKSRDDIPDDMKEAVNNREWGKVAGFIDKILPDARKPEMSVVIEGRNNELVREKRSGEVSLTRMAGIMNGSLFNVNFDPRMPHLYSIAPVFSGNRQLYMIFFFCGAIISLLYLVFFYPRLKDMTRQ